MNKKTIIGLVAVGVIATSLFAAGKSCTNANAEGKNSFGHYKKNNHQKGFKMQKMLKSLNLTQEQQVQIKEIVSKHKNNKVKMSDAFSKTEFDKSKFIQIASQKRDNMLKSKANMIEEVYSVLTSEQKLQLKVLMDLKMNKMTEKGFNSDKHSYGRG
jgi:Spy/CpxP family protein refolding chaperone